MNRLSPGIKVFDLTPYLSTPTNRIHDPVIRESLQILSDHYRYGNSAHTHKDRTLERLERIVPERGLLWMPVVGINYAEHGVTDQDRPFPERYYSPIFQEHLVLYRGFRHDIELSAFDTAAGWTFSYRKARGFRGLVAKPHNIFSHQLPKPEQKEVYIARALVHSKDILAWFPFKGENEVLFRPTKAFLIEVKAFRLGRKEIPAYQNRIYPYLESPDPDEWEE